MLVPGQAHVGCRDRVEGGVLVDVPVGDLVDRPQGRRVLAGHDSHPSLRRNGGDGNFRSATRRRLRGAPWCAKIGRRLWLPTVWVAAETGWVRRGRPRLL